MKYASKEREKERKRERFEIIIQPGQAGRRTDGRMGLRATEKGRDGERRQGDVIST